MLPPGYPRAPPNKIYELRALLYRVKVRRLERCLMSDIMKNYKQYSEHLDFVTRSLLGVLEEIIIIGVILETPMDVSLETPQILV